MSAPPPGRPRRRGRRLILLYWAVVLPVIAVVSIWRLGTALRPTGPLLIETDIPGLEVQVGDERMTLTANEVPPPFRASEWATGAAVRHVRPGAYRVKASLNGVALDEQTVVVVARETSHVAFRRPPAPGGWRALFNRHDLAGWTPHPDQPGNWTIENAGVNAVLTGRAPAGSLYTDRGDFRNFHLRLEGMLTAGADGSLCVRAPYARKTRFGDPAPPDGYAVRLSGSYFKDRRLGTLRGLANAAEDHHLDSKRWFKLEVIADGSRITTKVNDQTVVDYVDPEARYEAGHIALHLERGTAEALQVRRMEIKELPAKAKE